MGIKELSFLLLAACNSYELTEGCVVPDDDCSNANRTYTRYVSGHFVTTCEWDCSCHNVLWPDKSHFMINIYDNGHRSYEIYPGCGQ